MKKKLFLLSSTLSFSLLTGVVFDVVSCNKVTETVDETNGDTEKIIKQKTFQIKQKIKLLIDDYTTNPENEGNKDWFISIKNIINSKIVTERLRRAVNQISDSENKPLSKISLELNNMIKDKMMQLQDYVNAKVITDEDLSLPSNFQIIIDNNFNSYLTSFKIANFIEILRKLLNEKQSSSLLKKTSFISNVYLNFFTNNDEFINDKDIENNDFDQPDIFKIITDFVYSFSYAGITETFDYKECEILITGDVTKTKNLKVYASQQIKNNLNNSLSDQLLIYGNFSIKNFENLNNKLNWDFSDADVQTEIIEARIQAIREMIKNNSNTDF